MENATKALIIAATVLISLMVLSVGIYLFNMFSEYAYNNEQERASQALIEENARFTKYSDKTLTAHDIVTIANLVKDYNTKTEDNINLDLNNNYIENLAKNGDWLKLLEELEKQNKTYLMETIEYYDNGKIEKIVIK